MPKGVFYICVYILYMSINERTNNNNVLACRFIFHSVQVLLPMSRTVIIIIMILTDVKVESYSDVIILAIIAERDCFARFYFYFTYQRFAVNVRSIQCI